MNHPEEKDTRSDIALMMELDAEWKPDCQGKQDYDANIVRLSCRYYPPRPWSSVSVSDGFPSAVAGIYFGDGFLVKREFVAATEKEVKDMVEAWAKEKFENLKLLLVGKL